MLGKLIVDPEKCVRCGMCTHVCLTSVIDLDAATGLPTAAHPEDCKLCLICEAYCPAKALAIEPDYTRRHYPPALAEEV